MSGIQSTDIGPWQGQWETPGQQNIAFAQAAQNPYVVKTTPMSAAAEFNHIVDYRNVPGKPVFSGYVHVARVRNGYILVITNGTTPQQTFIAGSVQEVNERIAACMVAFKLEELNDDPGPV